MSLLNKITLFFKRLFKVKNIKLIDDNNAIENMASNEDFNKEGYEEKLDYISKNDNDNDNDDNIINPSDKKKEQFLNSLKIAEDENSSNNINTRLQVETLIFNGDGLGIKPGIKA